MGRFEDHVRAALDSLPPELARGLENVAVVIEERNPDEPDLYGLFDEPEYLPARISIYRQPLLEDFGDDPAALERRRIHWPTGRLAKPREIVNGALFLASDESSYVNGATFLVDGGLTAAYVTPE